MRKRIAITSRPSHQPLQWCRACGLMALTFFLVLCLTLKGTSTATAMTCPDIEAKPFTLIEAGPGLYVRQGAHEVFTPANFGAIANLSLIIGEKSAAVIDTGGSHCDGKRFLSAIRRLTKKPISYIILTHVHPDHTFGTAAFEGEGAMILGHANLERAMAQKGPLYLENLERLIGAEQMAGTKTAFTITPVTKEMIIDLGNRPLKLMPVKTAHTDQDLAVIDQATKTLFAGDLLFHGHIPVIDGSLSGWRQVLSEMANWPAINVVPGHGGPRLGFPKALKSEDEYLAKLAEDLRAIIAAGGTMLEAQKNAGQSEKNKWLLFDEFNARNASTAFAELEWE